MPPTAKLFRLALAERLGGAVCAGETSVDVSAGDLHREVGGYPGPEHRMPMCCSVIRQEYRRGDAIVSDRLADGPNFTIRFKLPRPDE